MHYASQESQSCPKRQHHKSFILFIAGAPLADGMYRPLSRPQEAWHFVMAAPPEDAESKTLDVTFTASGRLNAVVFWFELDLGSGIKLSTGPQATAAGAADLLLHWRMPECGDERRLPSRLSILRSQMDSQMLSGTALQTGKGDFGSSPWHAAWKTVRAMQPAAQSENVFPAHPFEIIM